MEDIRRFCRQHCAVPCQGRFASKSLTGEVVELSFDVALIARPSVLPPIGAKVVLRMAPSEEDVTVRARVVYLQKRGGGLFGIKFDGNCEENLDKLAPLFKRFVGSQ